MGNAILIGNLIEWADKRGEAPAMLVALASAAECAKVAAGGDPEPLAEKIREAIREAMAPAPCGAVAWWSPGDPDRSECDRPAGHSGSHSGMFPLHGERAMWSVYL